MKTVRDLEDWLGQPVQVNAGNPMAHTVMEGVFQGVLEEGILLSTTFMPGDSTVLAPKMRFIPWHNILEIVGDQQVTPVELV